MKVRHIALFILMTNSNLLISMDNFYERARRQQEQESYSSTPSGNRAGLFSFFGLESPPPSSSSYFENILKRRATNPVNSSRLPSFFRQEPPPLPTPSFSSIFSDIFTSSPDEASTSTRYTSYNSNNNDNNNRNSKSTNSSGNKRSSNKKGDSDDPKRPPSPTSKWKRPRVPLSWWQVAVLAGAGAAVYSATKNSKSSEKNILNVEQEAVAFLQSIRHHGSPSNISVPLPHNQTTQQIIEQASLSVTQKHGLGHILEMFHDNRIMTRNCLRARLCKATELARRGGLGLSSLVDKCLFFYSAQVPTTRDELLAFINQDQWNEETLNKLRPYIGSEPTPAQTKEGWECLRKAKQAFLINPLKNAVASIRYHPIVQEDPIPQETSSSSSDDDTDQQTSPPATPEPQLIPEADEGCCLL